MGIFALFLVALGGGWGGMRDESTFPPFYMMTVLVSIIQSYSFFRVLRFQLQSIS